MKSLQLLPLAYLADIHGFVYFAPYMLFVMVIAQVLAASRRRARRNTAGARHAAPAISVISVGAPDEAILAVART